MTKIFGGGVKYTVEKKILLGIFRKSGEGELQMKRKKVLAILLSVALAAMPATADAAEESIAQEKLKELPEITEEIGTDVKELIDISVENTNEATGAFRIIFTPEKGTEYPFTKFVGKIWYQ